MSRSARRLGLIFITWLGIGAAIAGDAPPPRESIDLRTTQVILAVDRNGRHQPFRATVLAIRDDELTILTAARFVSDADEGHPVRLFVNDGAIGAVWGTVRSVTRNPAYRPKGSRDVAPTSTVFPSHPHQPVNYVNQQKLSYGYRFPTTKRPGSSALNREVPGADNAVATLRFPARPGQADLTTRPLRPAPRLAASTYPGPSGGAVTARLFDADGRERSVRAGNFQNPRLLEWGHGFDPKSGDAGGGVFVLRGVPGGRPESFLIGVLMGPDERGGSASLVALDMNWLADALRDRGDDAEYAGPGSPTSRR